MDSPFPHLREALAFSYIIAHSSHIHSPAGNVTTLSPGSINSVSRLYFDSKLKMECVCDNFMDYLTLLIVLQ